MAGIFGHLGLSDTERVFRQTIGQEVIFQAAIDYINRINAQIERIIAIFIEEETERFKERYKLPGGGYLQRRNRDGRYRAVKVTGKWDVAYPLEDFGAQLAETDIAMAYMTVQELETHIQTVITQNVNTVRFEILKALFNNVADTFEDEIHGSLSIQPLANGDSVVYPPVQGSDDEATDNHYLEAGYLATAISDSNNPYATIVEELVEHYGESVGGDDIVVFIHPDEAPETEALTDFAQVPDKYVRQGDNVNVPVMLPNVPGRIIGRMEGSAGCWVSQWRWMPSGYQLGIHLGQPAPLKRRVDPADTGLGRGLMLVARDMNFPFESSFWRHRFGLGCGNRLNGVVMELANGGTYTVPTVYQ